MLISAAPSTDGQQSDLGTGQWFQVGVTEWPGDGARQVIGRWRLSDSFSGTQTAYGNSEGLAGLSEPISQQSESHRCRY